MNDLNVKEPTIIISDKDLKEIIDNSEYDSDKEVSFLRLDSGVIYVHCEMTEHNTALIGSDVFIQDVRVCLGDEQKESIRSKLEGLYNDISYVGTSESPGDFENRIDKLNQRFQ